MTANEDIDLFEQDNQLTESVCSGQRWNPKRKCYDVCEKKDSCIKHLNYNNSSILDNYHNLKFVKYYYLKHFKNCRLNEQVEV